MKQREYYIVDVFTERCFQGNAAAVVLDANDLSDATMQAMAAEFHLSETTFVLPSSSLSDGNGISNVRFRWFTPTVEVDMCGHATIAGVHALIESKRLASPADSSISQQRIDIETRSGKLSAFVEPLPGSPGEYVIWLELIPPVLTLFEEGLDELAEALNIESQAFDRALPPARTQDSDLLVFVENVAIVNAATPDFSALSAWLEKRGLRGLSLATAGTLTPSTTIQSRFFAPVVGVDEDPVTGSVHGPLARFAVEHQLVPVDNGVAGMQCIQGTPGGPGGRTGLVWALVQQIDGNGYNVRIGGRAITSMRGHIAVDL